jgi:ubiquitin-conjugating enzyme E2 I
MACCNVCAVREARIPGQEDTDWEGGEYSIKLEFSEDYPSRAPRVKFDPVIFHPNIFSSGAVCLSILNADWKASITVTELLVSLQWLLAHPNPDHVTDRKEPSNLCKRSPQEYARRIREQAKQFQRDAVGGKATEQEGTVGKKRARAEGST